MSTIEVAEEAAPKSRASRKDCLLDVAGERTLCEVFVEVI